MPSFHAPRLIGRPVVPADAPDILAIYRENEPLLLLLDHDQNPASMATRFVGQANLPKGGEARHLSNLVLTATAGPCVGLLSVYHGYPDPDVAYIGELFLRPAHQGQGLGREAYLSVEARLRAQGMRAARVGIGLRNWNALRFWIRLGFLRVTGMSGARAFAPNAFAFLELQKKL